MWCRVEHGGGGYTGYVTMQIANYVIKLITNPQPSAARPQRVTSILSDTEGGWTLYWSCTGEGIVFTQ